MVLQILLLSWLFVEPLPLPANHPNLVGKTVSQAMSIVQPMGIQLQGAGSDPSSVIISQNPDSSTPLPSPIPIGYYIGVVLRPIGPDVVTPWGRYIGIAAAIAAVLIVVWWLMRRRPSEKVT